MVDNNQQAFFALLNAGLWGTDVKLLQCGSVVFSEVQRLAEEQAVLGLVAAGLEHVIDTKVPKGDVIRIIGQTLQLEQRNDAMNHFIGDIVEKMRKADIYTLLVKGQGVAQCYEKPQWRASGDVDFLLSEYNYQKAIAFLTPLAASVDEENKSNRHIAMTINPWVVELHGSLRGGLWKRMNQGLDEVQTSIICGGNVRSWTAGNTRVFLPRADEDVVYVFAHILQHFFLEGIGLRQVCDWCRLLWTFKDSIDINLLKNRLVKMGVITEWCAFSALAVRYLGMPEEAIPLYSGSKCWQRKADMIMSFVLETGNFGHNRDYSYQKKYPFVVFKAISLWKHIKDFFRYAFIFPLDSVKVMAIRMRVGFSMAFKGRKHERGGNRDDTSVQCAGRNTGV